MNNINKNRQQAGHIRQKNNTYQCERSSSGTGHISRICGCILSAAIGDALGFPVEFLNSFQAIQAKFGPMGVTDLELNLDVDGRKVAMVSDDTQMTMVVLRTLAESKRRDLDLDATMNQLARGFVGWATNPPGGHRAPGRACLAGCQSLEQGVPWREAGGATAGGCGSVMRCYPFGLVFHDDLEKAERWSAEHSRLTHRAPIALAACAGMAVAVAMLLEGAEPEDAISGMMDSATKYSPKTADMIQSAVDDAISGKEPTTVLQRLQGWAAHECIAAAAYVFTRHPDDPKSALLEAANTPGDSDSIATLVGALVGVRCGIEKIPENWVANVEHGEELLALADELTELEEL